jgi:hypothetical protein
METSVGSFNEYIKTNNWISYIHRLIFKNFDEYLVKFWLTETYPYDEIISKMYDKILALLEELTREYWKTCLEEINALNITKETKDLAIQIWWIENMDWEEKLAFTEKWNDIIALFNKITWRIWFEAIKEKNSQKANNIMNN